MTSILYILVAISTCSLAHYRGYEGRNLIEREELEVTDGTLVECPVCENIPSWMPSHEECNIVKGDKRYKKCERGIYDNVICGNRPDCLRGPNEHCTENMDYDIFYGHKCARGYYCDNTIHACKGLGSTITGSQWLPNRAYRYPLTSQSENDNLNAKSIMLLA